MYRLRFYENGRYVTDLGGPLMTLPTAEQQMRKLASSVDATDITGFIGVTWLRSGETPCAIAIVDDFGHFISNKETETI